MELIADTTVLIDIWRFRRAPVRLADLVKKSKGASLVVPWITEAEFSRGALHKGVGREALEAFYGGFLRLSLNRKTIDCYCELWGKTAKKGKAPDYPDLWIAASAVAMDAPVLTRNPDHFSGVPGLAVAGYDLD
jgi:predicted nucleic acid-binding protein